MSSRRYFSMFRQIGPWEFLRLAFRKVFCALYKHRFRRCGALLLSGSFRITGHRFIEIGKLTAGEGLRIDAIHTYFDGSEFTPSLIIGEGVVFANGVHIACNHRVEIGDNSIFGSHLIVTDHDHGIYAGPGPHSRPDDPPTARALTTGGHVVIGRNVFVGEHVAILKNVTIGDGAVIAAGSVVTRDVPPATIAAGNPARVIRRWDPARREWVRAQ